MVANIVYFLEALFHTPSKVKYQVNSVIKVLDLHVTDLMEYRALHGP